MAWYAIEKINYDKGNPKNSKDDNVTLRKTLKTFVGATFIESRIA
jgi:hypothetical protein